MQVNAKMEVVVFWPDELTNALEISNIVFTSMFALEMLLKLLAFGIWGYIKNPYNIFDGIIVVISVWEIIGQADGGLSVLRTFRLLRVLKLVRFMPALRRQLVVLMKTMDNVATFCMLLMLFIFIFSILGMHLFGCKFGLRTETGDTMPDRKNFDSLLWAIVTVFQVVALGFFSGEHTYLQSSWNVLDGILVFVSIIDIIVSMASASGAKILGVLRVLRLLRTLRPLRSCIRVPVSEAKAPHSSQQDKGLGFVSRQLRSPDIIAKLSPNVCSVLFWGRFKGDANRSDTDEDKTSTNFEEEFEKLKELHASEMKMYSLAVTPNGHLEGKGSMPPPIIMHTAATPMPTPKGSPHMDTAYPFGDSRRGSNVSVEPLSFDQKSLSSLRSSPCANWGSRRSSWNSLGRAPSLKRKTQCSERESLLSGEGKGSTDDEAEEAKLSTLSRGALHHRAESLDCRGGLDLPELLQVPGVHPPVAMLPLEYQDCNGKLLQVPSELYLHLDGRKEDPFDYDDSMEDSLCYRIRKNLEPYKPNWCKNHEDWSLYLFSPQNRLRANCQRVIAHKMFDHIVLVFIFLNCITIALERPDIDPNSTEDRVISRAPGLKLVVETLISSLRPIGNIVLICCAFFIIFGILGVQLFKGKFYYCEGVDIRNISTKTDCRKAHYKWVRRKYNFDNLGQALMSLFVLSSKDGWVNIMYDGLDAVGIDQQPSRNHNLWMLLYFISFLLIVSFFVLNMFVGVVVENFHKCRQHQEAEEARRREEKRLRRLEKKRRSKAIYMSVHELASLLMDVACLVERGVVGNLGLLFMLLFFIYAALGVELFGKLDCSEENPCEGLSRHATFNNFGMAFLTLFRVSTGDNWNGIMKDTLRECHRDDKHCLSYLPLISPLYFVTFVLIAQFVLVNVVVAVLMKHLEESNKEAKEDAEMDAEIELEMSRGISTPERTMDGRQTPSKGGSPLLVKHQVMGASAAGGGLRDPQNLLTLRKISVARMHSLPNDSYMFRPVMPAKPPFPLHEGELEAFSYRSPREAQRRPYYADYSPARKYIHSLCTSHYLDLFITFIIGVNVITMSMEHFDQPKSLEEALKYCNYLFTFVFVVEAILKLVAFGFRRFFKDRWNQLDLAIVLLSIMGITLEEIEMNAALPINPTIIRIMRVLRIARVLKLLKMATGMRALLDTVVQALPQEAVRKDSLDSSAVESKPCTQGEMRENPPLKKLSHSILGAPQPPPAPTSLPGSPPLAQPSPPCPSSIQTARDNFSQHNISERRSTHSSLLDSSLFESSDLADEEVSHINSSAGDWGAQLESRDCSDSPFVSPAPSPVPFRNCSTTSLTMGKGKEKDLKKFYSVDTRGFLAKPTWADDQRRHSIEICPSVGHGDRGFAESSERRRLPLQMQSESEYLHGIRRKKKMSPPCISIDPPMEEDSSATTTRNKASENSLLRRRTPSCESTAYRDSLELAEGQPGELACKADRRAPPACRGEHLTIPNFSYKPTDPGSMGETCKHLSESNQSAGPSVDSPPEGPELPQTDPPETQGDPSEANQEGLGGGKKCPLPQHGQVPGTPSNTEEGVDEPV
ncbi:PREDICTED: voltage-dependent T-type calcium channel subunit alpha-1H-like [Thamnophis sirtalis]|uniref:Voltage-dependent T-type calcium channel subunit alpha-1H-like n=1 Tax=Thamnophis sirtalis TaxID=35019 RepID=A0A6I9Y7D8_9SAUR|nr:PREDICTED: voltage-dependent T-type calcium channel subunit alpha-1H-like [Thamnophis sirtalis]